MKKLFTILLIMFAVQGMAQDSKLLIGGTDKCDTLQVSGNIMTLEDVTKEGAIPEELRNRLIAHHHSIYRIPEPNYNENRVVITKGLIEKYTEWCNELTVDTVSCQLIRDEYRLKRDGRVLYLESYKGVSNRKIYNSNEVYRRVLHDELVEYYAVGKKKRCKPTFEGFYKWLKK